MHKIHDQNSHVAQRRSTRAQVCKRLVTRCVNYKHSGLGLGHRFVEWFHLLHHPGPTIAYVGRDPRAHETKKNNYRNQGWSTWEDIFGILNFIFLLCVRARSLNLAAYFFNFEFYFLSYVLPRSDKLATQFLNFEFLSLLFVRDQIIFSYAKYISVMTYMLELIRILPKVN